MQKQSIELGTLANPRTWLLSIGLGLMLCHLATYSLTALRLPLLEIPGIVPKYFTIASLLVEIATYITLAVLSSRWPCGMPHKRALVIGATLGCFALSVVQCCVLANGNWGFPLAMGIFRSVVRGVCPALLWIAWVETLARFDLRHVLASYIVASVFSAVLTLFASHLPSIALNAANTIVLIASVVVLLALQRNLDAGDEQRTEPEAEPGTWAFPVVPVLLMAMFTFANVFARNVLQLENRGIVDAGVVVVMALSLIILAMPSSRFKAWNLYALAFPLTLFGLFMLGDPQGTFGPLASICIHAGDSLFAVFIGVILCNISYRWGVPAAMLFGYAKAAGATASLCGGFAASYALGLADDMFTLLLALVGTGLVVCYVAFSNAAATEVTWGIPAQDAEAANPGPTPAVSREENERIACSQLAYRYGLTRREEQVLCLVSRGLTAAQIEEALSVSNSTVKTHTSAVFHKLGVHSRKEIVDMVSQLK